MKLGAQFFSIRSECQNPNALYNSMKKIKEIGYEIIQISGVCDIEAEELKAFSEELSLPITCTHKSYDLIVNNTDELIKYHKTISCPVIGLGGMPVEMRDSLEGIRTFISSMKEPIKKINAAGLSFGYHNHAFEFNKFDNKRIYDILIEELPEAEFIHDVYWSKYAGVSCIEYIELLGKEKRITNIHFKDMKTEPQGPICPCGEGVTDFAPIAQCCKKYGIENILVEQDNAPDLGDVFAQMKSSFDHLNPIVHI